MKILNRNYEHKNLILFLVLSLVYLQAIYSLSRGVSILSSNSFKDFFLNHYLIFSLTLVSIMMIYQVRKHSDKVLLLCLSMMTAKNFMLLSGSFNKFILVLNFIYLVFAFYFFVTWEVEVAKASYNPLFTKNDLEKENRFKIGGQLNLVDHQGQSSFLVTNLDDKSCFVLLTSNEGKLKLDQNTQVNITAEYEGVFFSQRARFKSSYDRGIGLEFIEEEKNQGNPSWIDLYKVCLDRGLFQ